MKRYWWEELSKDELDMLMYIKNNDIIRPLYKLLVLIYLNYKKSEILKDVLGGNYSVLLKEAVIRGYVNYERGKPPSLTPNGERIAKLTLEFLEKLREEEKKLIS